MDKSIKISGKKVENDKKVGNPATGKASIAKEKIQTEAVGSSEWSAPNPF